MFRWAWLVTANSLFWGMFFFFSLSFFEVMIVSIVWCCCRRSVPLLFPQEITYIYYSFPCLFPAVWIHTDSAVWVDNSPSNQWKAADCFWILCSLAGGPLCLFPPPYIQHILRLAPQQRKNLSLYNHKCILCVLKYVSGCINYLKF